MDQPTNRRKTSTSSIKRKRTLGFTAKNSRKGVRKHPKYGTSKLEDDFARDFLDKLGVKYIYQFEAKDIGRFYDFAVFINGDTNDLSSGNILILEIDGSYWHSDPRLVKESEMSPTQKKNKRIDELKDKWALMHGIPIVRFWEKDIRENPKMVLGTLKERLHIESSKKRIKDEKNKRHVNRIR